MKTENNEKIEICSICDRLYLNNYDETQLLIFTDCCQACNTILNHIRDYNRNEIIDFIENKFAENDTEKDNFMNYIFHDQYDKFDSI